MTVTVIPGLSSPRVEPVNASTPSTALSVKRATLTFDRTWSPYIQGSLVCRALSPAAATASDPRKGLAVKFTLSQQVGAAAAQQLPLVAWLRSRGNDVVNDEATIAFASVESLLQDRTDFNGMQYAAAVTDVTMVNDVLGYLRWDASAAYPSSLGAVQTIDGAASFSIPAASAGWDVGTTLWEAINGAEEAGGLWVRGDTSGVVLQRSAADYSADTTTHLLTGTDRILTVSDDISRDNPDWANSAFINYVNTATGATTTDYGTIATLGSVPLKTLVATRESKRVATGAALSWATRANRRGRVLTVSAIADLTCRPNQTWRVQYRGYDWTTKVQAVTFRYPEGLMDMTLNVIET